MPLLWKQCKYSKQHNKCKQCEPFMWLPPALMVLSLLWQHFTSAGPRGHCKCTVYHYYYHWGEMYVFSGAGCLSMKRGYWELCLSFFPLPCKGKGGVWHILVSGTSYTTKRTIRTSPQFWCANRMVAFIFISRLVFVQFQLHLPLDLLGNACPLYVLIYWSVLIDKR